MLHSKIAELLGRWARNSDPRINSGLHKIEEPLNDERCSISLSAASEAFGNEPEAVNLWMLGVEQLVISSSRFSLC